MPGAADDAPCAASRFRTIVQSAVALLFPSLCAVCRKSLLLNDAGAICQQCQRGFQSTRLGPCCAVCAEPLGFESVAGRDGSQPLCGVCAAEQRPFTRATAFGSYDGLRHALRLYKFQKMQMLARPLGALLAEAVLQHGDELPIEVTVIPVPLHRQTRRPYNQSLLLAQAALPAVRRSVSSTRFVLRPSLLRRVRQGQRQYGLSPEERRANVRGAFHVRGDVTGLHILLIDDVFTTGATCAECSQQLLAAGAASVRIATLARAGHSAPEVWSPANSPSSVHRQRETPVGTMPLHFTSTGPN